VRRVAALALVTAAAATAAPAAAATRPAPQRLWHAFPLGGTKLVQTPRAAVSGRRSRRVAPAARRARPAREDSFHKVLAAVATAITVLAIVAAGRRRGWVGARSGTSGRRVGTESRALALYAVAAIIGVLVGLLIPLLA
jgi:hypothetical protein